MVHLDLGAQEHQKGAETASDQSMTFKVEDTPANISGESSLSSLSVESLSFEPTAAENALLEECINSGMPKSTRKAKKKDAKSVSSRTTPTSEVVMRRKSQQNEPSVLTDNQETGKRDVEGNTPTAKPKNDDRLSILSQVSAKLRLISASRALCLRTCNPGLLDL